MNGLPDRRVTEKEVEALRQSPEITKLSSGHRYSGVNKSDEFSRLEITLQSGTTEELMYAGENGKWIVLKDTNPGDTGFWGCDACGKEIWGEREEPPLHHIHNCEEAGPNSLSFCEE